MILEPGHRQWIEKWKRYYQENMQRNIERENKLELFFMYFTILITGAKLGNTCMYQEWDRKVKKFC